MTTTVNPTAGAKVAADVSALLRARNPLLWIVTREEARVERFLVEATQTASYEPRFWDCATGLTKLDGNAINGNMTDPAEVLAAIRTADERQVYILRDFPTWLRDPSVLRSLRSLARTLPAAKREEARAVVILTPSSEIPPELSGHAVVVEWPMPDRAEIAALLDAVIGGLPADLQASAAPNGTRDAAVDAAVGLTAEEAQSCYAKSLVQLRKIDPAAVAKEKKRVIASSKVLEWYDPIPGGLAAVGGLEVLKDWLAQRRTAFSPAARAYGLPAPRGVLLCGIPGTGKSLTAKAVATAWGMPLLRLDMGGLKSKYVGDSEGNLRKALKLAETVSPCVLWVDEIEKALSGATQGAADGGVSADALGTILSWMQERQGSVFVVATANDVSALPPELSRKGRFDELFFVDLPNVSERAAIVAAALKAHGRTLESIDLASVATATDGFSGAELAELVPSAMYEAFADAARAVTTTDLLVAALATVPMSKTSAEKVTALRAWAKDRARSASAAPTSTTNGKANTGRALDLE